MIKSPFQAKAKNGKRLPLIDLNAALGSLAILRINYKFRPHPRPDKHSGDRDGLTRAQDKAGRKRDANYFTRKVIADGRSTELCYSTGEQPVELDSKVGLLLPPLLILEISEQNKCRKREAMETLAEQKVDRVDVEKVEW